MNSRESLSVMALSGTLQETSEFASDLDLRDFLKPLSVPEVHGLITKHTREVIKITWEETGPLLLSWTGLLGHRKFLASGQLLRNKALPRSSSSAKGGRAGVTACR